MRVSDRGRAEDEAPRWPLELGRLQAAILGNGAVGESDGGGRDDLRGAFWSLAYEALALRLRQLARSAGSVEAADLEDIAAEKSLELLLRAESGAWDLGGRTASEISGYIANVARNGWVDYQKRRTREPSRSRLERSRPEPTGNGEAVAPEVGRPIAASVLASLRSCVEALPARGRRAWFLRVYHGSSGADIGAHPSIRANAAHVDVLVQRARTALRDCLERKGHGIEDVSGAAFVEIWDLIEALALEEEPRPPRARGGDEHDAR